MRRICSPVSPRVNRQGPLSRSSNQQSKVVTGSPVGSPASSTASANTLTVTFLGRTRLWMKTARLSAVGTSCEPPHGTFSVSTTGSILLPTSHSARYREPRIILPEPSALPMSTAGGASGGTVYKFSDARPESPGDARSWPLHVTHKIGPTAPINASAKTNERRRRIQVVIAALARSAPHTRILHRFREVISAVVIEDVMLTDGAPRVGFARRVPGTVRLVAVISIESVAVPPDMLVSPPTLFPYLCPHFDQGNRLITTRKREPLDDPSLRCRSVRVIRLSHAATWRGNDLHRGRVSVDAVFSNQLSRGRRARAPGTSTRSER